jgi:FkbM family methyltransferase
MLDYLFAVQLNVGSNSEIGEASNQRLRGLFMELIEKIAPKAFFDIGARDGESAVAVKRQLPACRTYAFEANPNLYKQFAAEHAADGHIDYRNLTIADQSGVIDLYVPRLSSEVVIGDEMVKMEYVETSDTGRSSLLKRTDPGATYEIIRVKAVALDKFCREEKIAALSPTAFWIDVEGAAHLVIAGAKRSIKNAAIIFIEVEGHAFWDGQAQSHTVIGQLTSLGFVPIARDREYYDKQFNVLLLRRDYLQLAIPLLYDHKNRLSLVKSNTEQIAALSARLDAVESATARARTQLFKNLVPIIIPTFNNPTFLKSMVTQLEALNCVNIMIVDNASTFPAMLQYLEQLSRRMEVLYMPDNAGPRRVWTDAAFFKKLPKVFCVTDPDLQLNAEMPLNFTDCLFALSEKYKMGKVGLALDIADVQALREDDYRIGDRDYKIWEWESQFWQTEVESDVFVALVDTTFALYNKNYFDPSAPLNALRVGGKFTCQHLPWLKSYSLPDDEVAFYRETNRHSYYLPNVDSGPPKS